MYRPFADCASCRGELNLPRPRLRRSAPALSVLRFSTSLAICGVVRRAPRVCLARPELMRAACFAASLIRTAWATEGSPGYFTYRVTPFGTCHQSCHFESKSATQKVKKASKINGAHFTFCVTRHIRICSSLLRSMRRRNPRPIQHRWPGLLRTVSACRTHHQLDWYVRFRCL